MYRIAHGSSLDMPDAAAFIESTNSLEQNPVAEARRLFDGRSDLFVTRAPGRLDVMGGIADYSGSLVLQLPIREATFVALQRCPSNKLMIVTLADEPTREKSFKMSLDELKGQSEPIGYETARRRFEGNPARHWSAYVAGAFLVLMRERGIRFQGGARILIDSRVPEGKGVASSAALEVAAMQAIAAAFEIAMTPRETALLCQLVENLVVGAPCGVMDQMTAACGEENRLLALLCQPAELKGTIPIPEGIAFWGLDSGVKHSVGGADYGSVRAGAFMGYRMIADMAGLKAAVCATENRVQINDPRWHGYLANLTPEEFGSLEARLPEQMAGAEFLSRFQGTTDSISAISPRQTYAVRAPTAHPVFESDRVRRFRELMDCESGEVSLEALGELMYQSHASYSACGLGSEGTDTLVRLVREAGPERGLFGARITGGGSGGTVAVIGRRNAGLAIEDVVRKYAEATGYRPYVFSGSSRGGAAFGFLKLESD